MLGIDLNEMTPLRRQIALLKDRLYGTFIHTQTAPDAAVRINEELRGRLKRNVVLARMDAINRTNLCAGGVFAADARFSNYVDHGKPQRIRYGKTGEMAWPFPATRAASDRYAINFSF
jgi:hypothetical protein